MSTSVAATKVNGAHELTLIITSLLSVLLLTIHLTQDTLRARAGTAEASGSTLVAVPILAVWVYGTLVLTGRRSSYIIILVGSVLALGMPIIHWPIVHLWTSTVGNDKSAGAFFFVWTLMALGVNGMFSIILAVHGLRDLRLIQRRPGGE